MTTDMSCSIRSTDVLWSARIDRRSALSSADSRGLSPAAGSSRQRSTGSVHIARAIHEPNLVKPVLRPVDALGLLAAIARRAEQPEHSETACEHERVVVGD